MLSGGPIRKTRHSINNKNRLAALEELRFSDARKEVLRNEADAVGIRNMLETIEQLVNQNGVIFKGGFQIERRLGVLDVNVLECVDDTRFPEYVSDI
jgi:hypothetical protein